MGLGRHMGCFAVAVALVAACGDDGKDDDDDTGGGAGFGRYSVKDYCNAYCDCQGCSQDQLADCIDSGEDQGDDVIQDGCGDLWQAYLDCLGEETTCVDGSIDSDGCENEQMDVAQCASAGQGGQGGG